MPHWKRMLSSAAWVKSHKDIAADTAVRIASAMQTAGRDRALFERELMRQGIGVVFRTNDAGRIYGATFINHADKTVFNGSRLGKEFSANVFNDLFAGQDGIHPPQQTNEREFPAGVSHEPEESPGEYPAQQPGHSGASQWNGHDTGYQPDHKDNTAQNVADAFSLFAPVQGGASGDQSAPQQRKRKKKRRYGRQQ